MARKTRRTQRLKVVNPDCAGVDIGKDRHFVAVDPERTGEPVRSFGAFTRDLEAMADWLASCGVTKVAMESTSVYWIPVYETLDRAGFEVMLVPPRMTKQIGGRKSDVLDCQWVWQLMSYGLLRGAFRPGDEVCPLRSCARQMRRLTEDRSRCVLHMQKALTEISPSRSSAISPSSLWLMCVARVAVGANAKCYAIADNMAEPRQVLKGLAIVARWAQDPSSSPSVHGLVPVQ